MLEPRTLPSEKNGASDVAIQAEGSTQPTNKVARASNVGGGIGGIIAGGMTLYGEGTIREVIARINGPLSPGNPPLIGESAADLLVFIFVSAAVYFGTKYGARAAAYDVLDKPNVPMVPGP